MIKFCYQRVCGCIWRAFTLYRITYGSIYTQYPFLRESQEVRSNIYQIFRCLQNDKNHIHTYIYKPISAKAVLFSVLHVFVSWFDYVGAKKRTGFDIRTKKATHQSTIRKFDTIRWDSITSNILCLHCILYSQVNNLLTIITRHIHRHYLYKTIAFEQFSQKQLR